MVLAAFLFIRRMATVSNVSVITREIQQGLSADGGDEELLDPRAMLRGVEVYEINGPFFFGAAQSFKDAVSQVAGHPRVLILRMVDNIDLAVSRAKEVIGTAEHASAHAL